MVQENDDPNITLDGPRAQRTVTVTIMGRGPE